jgi:hypothetical protein
MAQQLGDQLAQDMLDANLNCDTLPISIKAVTKTIAMQLKYTNRTNISILDLGMVHIAMIPGEPLEGFADNIESLLPGTYPMVFGMINDEIEYIIPENEWNACTNIHYGTCYEESESAGISVAGILENGYKELLNQ